MAEAAELIDFTCEVVRECDTVAEGMPRLLAKLKAALPKERDAHVKLSAIDWASDAEQMAAHLRDTLAACPEFGTSFTGMYFGLDGLNMPIGKGVEWGMSTAHEVGKDEIEYIYRCDTYLDDLPSPALAESYTPYGEYETEVEYLIQFGYLALALKQAFSSMPRKIALNGARERAIACGFHDGDMMLLGFVTPGGFVTRAKTDGFEQTGHNKARNEAASAFEIWIPGGFAEQVAGQRERLGLPARGKGYPEPVEMTATFGVPTVCQAPTGLLIDAAFGRWFASAFPDEGTVLAASFSTRALPGLPPIALVPGMPARIEGLSLILLHNLPFDRDEDDDPTVRPSRFDASIMGGRDLVTMGPQKLLCSPKFFRASQLSGLPPLQFRPLGVAADWER
jgi:hypothetical protein